MHLATTTSHHPRTRARMLIFEGGFRLPLPPGNHHLLPPLDTSTTTCYRGWWLFATTPPPGTHRHLLPPLDTSTDTRFRGCLIILMYIFINNIVFLIIDPVLTSHDQDQS